MLVEVSIAVNYILSHLYTKLPRRRVDSFGEELERYLHAKYQQHWFPQDPMRDAAYRCLNVGGPQVDLLLPEAAAVSGLDWGEIQACLPEGLVLSVDPGHVACQYHQPQFTAQEFNRYQGTPFWPSASVSLSSSGCSSASSSISSTNLTPTSNQVTHQVLYCFQDSWFANNGNPWTDGTANGNVQNKVNRIDTEHGDNLATAAALSVLVDTEDNFSSNLGSDLSQKPNELSFNAINGMNVHAPSLENTDLVHLLLRDVDLNGAPSNGSDNRISTGNLGWSATDTADATNGFVTLMNGELNQGLAPASQAATFSEKSRTTTLSVLNRSSSNPPAQTDQLNLPIFNNDYSALSTTNLNTNANALSSAAAAASSSPAVKFDLSGNPVFTGSVHPRFMNAIYGQPGLSQLTGSSGNNSHFVQKSVSTPSFTAATFAQTKFGSTKLKTHSKRTPNRILSPTTTTGATNAAPQTFTAFAGSNLIGRDSINVASLGPPNQRISHGTTGLELNPIQRLLPTSMELGSLGQTGKPIASAELPTSLDTAVERSAPGFAPGSGSVVAKKLFPFGGVAPQPPPPSGKETMQPNLFDDLFPRSVDEAAKISDDPFGNVNFPETLHQPLSNATTKLWPNASSVSFYRGDTSGLLTGSDWLQSPQAFHGTEMLAAQPTKPTSTSSQHHHLVQNNSAFTMDNHHHHHHHQSSGKLEDPVDLSHDDALLCTTRMVSLLLEDDVDTSVDSTKDTGIATTGATENASTECALGLVNGQSKSVLDNISNELGTLTTACTE